MWHRNCDGAKYITRNFKFAEIESSEKKENNSKNYPIIKYSLNSTIPSLGFF